jgi:hypothetical protein
MSKPEPPDLALLPVLADGSGDIAAARTTIELAFRAIEEPRPGERWRRLFDATWPAYRAWYLKDSESARPDLRTCRRMLERWMPELVETFEQLVALAGGDALAARFLVHVPAAWLRGRMLTGGFYRRRRAGPDPELRLCGLPRRGDHLFDGVDGPSGHWDERLPVGTARWRQ